MGLRDILPETKIYENELYGHKWKIEVRILSYKAKQEYLAMVLRNKKIRNEEIDFSNLDAKDLLEIFHILYYNGLVRLEIDGEEEKVNKETYDYLINNLGQACEWIQYCILEVNGNFFLVKK